jgi:hypothetical protein
MKKNLILLIIIGIFALFSNVFFAQAATPESFFYLSWEADGFVPNDYTGKVLPVIGSWVKISIQPLIYIAGQYSDSSLWNYRWYIDDEFSGVENIGSKNFRFKIKGYNATMKTVKVKITFPNGVEQEKSIIIPIVSPRIIMNPIISAINMRNRIINTNESEIALIATPYFFGSTCDGLNMRWYINKEHQITDILETNIFVVKKDYGINSSLDLVVNCLNDSLIRATDQIRINFLGI